MQRINRAVWAKETLDIIASGQYTTGTHTHHLGPAIAQSVQQTTLWLPEALQALAEAVLSDSRVNSPSNSPSNSLANNTPETPGPANQHLPRRAGKISVVNESTLAGAQRLALAAPDVPGVLNFASARNPGGGFLGGSQAQEESLARSSALYASQTSAIAAPYYEYHRANSSLLYSDRAIFTPACPVFRADDGSLLEAPYLVHFLTAAAPNAGAVARNQPEFVDQIPAVFARRLHLVLALALHAGCRRIVLGAWGCGVFANDVTMVANAFAAALRGNGAFAGRFDEVVFSVLDHGKDQKTVRAFEQALLKP